MFDKVIVKILRILMDSSLLTRAWPPSVLIFRGLWLLRLVVINGDGLCDTASVSLGRSAAQVNWLGPKIDGCSTVDIRRINCVNVNFHSGGDSTIKIVVYCYCYYADNAAVYVDIVCR